MKIRLKEFLPDIKMAFSDEIWTTDLEKVREERPGLYNFLRPVKLTRIVFDHFAEKRMGFQAASLSYFGALAFVPLVAFVFFITGGLGLEGNVITTFLAQLGVKIDEETLVMVEEKAGNIITYAKSSIVGLISALTFLWAILWWLFQVERALNYGFGLRNIKRNIFKRFSFYLIMLFLSPFILIMFTAGMVLYSNMFELMGLDFTDYPFLKSIFGWLIFYAVGAFTISAIYKFVPNKKVKYSHALRSALIFGAIFTAFQFLYLSTQMFVSRINGVYGAIAAIPLFLIWMNLSWQILIYGEQLVFAYENVDCYLPEDLRYSTK